MTDHTAAILAKLGITQETHSELWVLDAKKLETQWADFRKLGVLTKDDDCYSPRISLLSSTLEADGLAVRLVGIAAHKKSFAHAAHDVLVEALGIKEQATCDDGTLLENQS